MKILIAGGAGYIGSVLIPKLLSRGYDIDVLDLFWFGNHLPDEVGVINRDLFDLEESDLHGYDQVIFLAGVSNDPMAEFSPAKNFISNASAPAFLCYLAKKAGARRFIYAGSCSVYGYTVNELYDETRPAVSSYPYGISKLQGETAVIQMIDDGFSVIALRQGTVCGYSPRMRLDVVVNAMFKSAVVDRVVTVNNASIWRPMLCIQDAATAYIRSIESNPDISGIFNVASGNYTIGEIGDLVQSGVKKYLDIDARLQINNVQDFRNYKVSIDKAKAVLSFHPKENIETATRDLAENIDQFKDFDNMNYYNIQVFKALSEQPVEALS
jgi:nucleoside-diphosphate-sugar epimerase